MRVSRSSVPQLVSRPARAKRSVKPPEEVACAEGADDDDAFRVLPVPIQVLAKDRHPAFGVRIADAVAALAVQSHCSAFALSSGQQTLDGHTGMKELLSMRRSVEGRRQA